MRRRPAPGRGLSGKILLLAIAFVLLGEVLIYLPSIARFRYAYLEARVAAAHLATIAVEPERVEALPPAVEADLLRYAGVVAITLYRPRAELMLGREVPVDREVDLRGPGGMYLIRDAVETLLVREPRTLRVLGASVRDSAVMVDIVMPEAVMRTAMVDYSARILTLSLVLSAIVASLLFLSLQVLIVRPLRRITGELAAFRERPEDAAGDPALPKHPRADEIGVVEGELAAMRRDLRRALAEKTRLAALGAALGRVSHELRNILSSAALVSDRLAVSADPQVRQLGARVMESLDRAIRLSAETLRYASSRPEPPVARPVVLAELVDRVRADLADRPEPVRWRVARLDPDLTLLADPDQLHRVLLNLARNAYEAMGLAGGEVAVSATAADEAGGLRLELADTGPGIPERVRERLFEPFAGTTKPDGSGLGLAICRELMRAQGGDIALRRTGPGGTIFELTLPPRAILRGDDLRRHGMVSKRVAAATLLLLATALGACSWRGPSLAGYDGLQFEVISFYDANAMEKNATCPQPRMQAVTRAQVVEETPQRVVMNIKYHFRDEGQADYDNDDGFPPFGGGGSLNRCDGFAERTFTFAKNTAGGLDVVSMTGPQRRS
jgi:signal transduction histidine kinase